MGNVKTLLYNKHQAFCLSIVRCRVSFFFFKHWAFVYIAFIDLKLIQGCLCTRVAPGLDLGGRFTARGNIKPSLSERGLLDGHP